MAAATNKKKRVLTTTLISILIAVILIGMGVGIYFIITDRGSGLSSAQRNFGDYINTHAAKPEVSQLDVSSVPEDMNVEDIVIYTENYIVAKDTETKGYQIYSRLDKAYVSITSEFAEILEIKGHIAILSTDETRLLVNLKTGEKIMTLYGAYLYSTERYVLVRASSPAGIELTNNSGVRLAAVVFDGESLERVFEATNEGDLIDISLAGNYLVANFTQKTELYSLEEFVLIKTFTNVGQKNDDGNITGTLNQSKYLMQEYTSVSSVSQDVLLVEKSVLVNDEQYDFARNGLKYNFNYSIFDAKRGKEFALENDGCIIRSANTGLSKYFAVVSVAIDNKTTIDETKQTISYYGFNGKGTGLVLFVSYDYIKQGKIVGFNGKQLITSGGKESSFIDFDGVGSAVNSSGDKVSMNGYDDVIIVTDVLGRQSILKPDGKVGEEQQWFVKISSFTDKKALAYDGNKFYILTSTGKKTEINNFAEEYANYLFMGLNMYFVKTQSGYDVYDLSQKKLYSAQDIKITQENQQTLLVKLIGEQQVVLRVVAQDKFAELKLVQKSSATLARDKAKQSNFASNRVAGETIRYDAELEDPTTTLNELGVGTATFSLNVDLANLSFREISSLNEEELALLPHDSEGGFNFTDQNETAFVGTGAYFYSAKNMAVAILRLENGEQFSYLVVIALKDTYLAKVEANSSLAGESKSLVNFVTSHRLDSSALDYSSYPVPACKLGLAHWGLYNDEETTADKLSPSVSFFDGTLVLASDVADSLSLSITLRNTAVAELSSLDGELGGYIFAGSFMEDEPQTFALNFSKSYAFGEAFSVDALTSRAFGSVIITKVANGGVVHFVAGEGYLFKKLVLGFGVAAASVYEDVTEADEEVWTGIGSTYDFALREDCPYIKIKGIEVVEAYYKINLVSDEETTDSLYYFYGYSSSDKEGARNPAVLGFQDFYRRDTVSVPLKVGHTFRGYQYVGADDVTYDITDENGRLRSDATNLVVLDLSGEWTEFDFVALFEPNKYSIFYVSNNESIVAQDEVTFGEQIGELYNIADSEYAPVGYDFLGWFDKDNTQYTTDTVYEVDGNITLYASWTPHVWEVTLHSNIENYTDKDVLGFVYNIAQILANGEAFETTTTNITFGQTYGSLPALTAVGAEGTNERYLFVGWFTSPTFTANGNGTFDRGEQILSSTEVSESPATDLYAHFIREVYSVNVSTNGDKTSYRDETPLDLFDNLTYSGSDVNGNKGEFVSAESWFADQGSTSLWTAYVLQASQLVLKTTPGEGYFVASVNIKWNNADGTTQEAILNGSWDGQTQTWTFENAPDESGYTAAIEEGTLVLTINNIFDALVTENGIIALEVGLNFASKNYTHSFNVLGDGAIEGENVELVDEQYVNKNILFGGKYEYTIAEASAELYNSSLTADKSVLKSISIGDQVLSFTWEYDVDSSFEYYYYYKLTCDRSVDGEETTGEYIQYSYNIREDDFIAVLTIGVDLTTSNYTYRLTLASYSDVRISVEFESLSINASLGVDNLSDEGSESGAIVERYLYENGKERVPVDQTTSVTPEQNLVYTITPENDHTMITSLIIEIGGREYRIASPKIELQSNENAAPLLYPGYMANTDIFTQNGDALTLNGTGLKIEWLRESNSFVITINSLWEDISVKLTTLSYRVVVVEAEEARAEDFAINITGGEDGFVDSSLAEKASEGLVYVAGNICYRYDSDNQWHCYYIFGFETSIISYNIVSKQAAAHSYKLEQLSALPEGSAQINAEKTVASCTQDNYFVKVDLLEASATVVVEGYLSRGVENGQNVYVKDPYDGEKLSNITFIYYDQNGEERTFSYTPSYTITFYGNTIIFKVYTIVGYTFNHISLLADGAVELEPTESNGSDEGGTYRQFTYVLTNFSYSSYVFSCYQDAISYTVHYRTPDDVDVSGETADSYHYFNVFKQLSKNGFSKRGYDFVGWSRSPKLGADLTASDAEFVDEEMLSVNLRDTDGEVTLYAVFVAKRVYVTYIYNDSQNGKGSTQAQNIGATGVYQLVVDHVVGNLQKLERVGYNFVGWAIKDQPDARILQDTEMFTADLYEQFEIFDGAINLYAVWTAKIYNVTIVANDVNDGNGSTEATTNQQLNVEAVFDQDIELGGFSRIGYTFLGYKGVKITSDEVSENQLKYLFVGNEHLTRINAEWTTGNVGIDISRVNNVSDTINIYAVYNAQSFRVYVDLNNRQLKSYGYKESETAVQIPNNETFYSSVEWVEENAYYLVKFDHALSSLPTVTPKAGYECAGFDFESGDSLEARSPFITSSSVLNYDVFKLATFRDKDGLTQDLATLYESRNYMLSIYAFYQISKITLNLEPNTEDLYHLENLENYSEYASEFPGQSEQPSISGEYGSDFVFDLIPKEGYYYKSITISYTTKEGTAGKLVLSFEWQSQSKTVVLTLNNKTYSFTDGLFSTVISTSEGKGNYPFNELSIKAIGYDHNDADSNKIDSIRIVLAMNFVKDTCEVTTERVKQTYKISYYEYGAGDHGISTLAKEIEEKTRIVEYGYLIKKEDLSGYNYNNKFKFKDYYWVPNYEVGVNPEDSDGVSAQINDIIYEDKFLVAVYEISLDQGVNFYLYNPEDESYEFMEELSSNYTISKYDEVKGSWVDGSSDYVDMEKGVLKKLPSPSSSLWPENCYFAGYVLIEIDENELQKNRYYTWESLTSADDIKYRIFDTTTMIEERVCVVAVYNEIKFDFTLSTSQSGDSGVGASLDYSLFEYLPKGGIRQLEDKDIHFVTLNQAQLGTFSQNSGLSAEFALRAALGNDFDLENTGTFDNWVNLSPNQAETIYVFAFILAKDSSGKVVIRMVADHYYGIENGKVSEYLTNNNY